MKTFKHYILLTIAILALVFGYFYFSKTTTQETYKSLKKIPSQVETNITALNLNIEKINTLPAKEQTRKDGFSALKLTGDAKKQIGVTLNYDPAYSTISYLNGDVDIAKGVCTDVVIRAMRKQGIDLQKLVHEDMKAHFSVYPKYWGLHKTDKNIDHRRVLNLEVFLQRKGKSLKVSKEKKEYLTGDLVTWRINDKLPHIGIVSDKTLRDGTPLVIHNIGRGTQEQDVLFRYTIIAHYRW
jgi:uncharacterized protein YijF (DUF1287 family)